MYLITLQIAHQSQRRNYLFSGRAVDELEVENRP